MSFQQVVSLYARYNRRANESLAAILAKTPELVTREGTMWYGSVLGTLNHIVLSDTVWLRRMWPDARERSPLLGIEFSSVDEVVFPGLDEWSRHRSELDQGIVGLCQALTEPLLEEPVHYRTSRGEGYAQPRWQLLIHMFNHETHHRGQVAQVLDAAGVDNDVSNLVWYLREGL